MNQPNPTKGHSRPTAAVDFDGTIAGYDSSGGIFPQPGAREAIQKMRSMGFHVVVHTCRMGIAIQENRLSEEISWVSEILAHWGIEVDEIYIGHKFVADVYIDDRAVPHTGDWSDTFTKTVSLMEKRSRGHRLA